MNRKDYKAIKPCLPVNTDLKQIKSTSHNNDNDYVTHSTQLSNCLFKIPDSCKSEVKVENSRIISTNNQLSLQSSCIKQSLNNLSFHLDQTCFYSIDTTIITKDIPRIINLFVKCINILNKNNERGILVLKRRLIKYLKVLLKVSLTWKHNESSGSSETQATFSPRILASRLHVIIPLLFTVRDATIASGMLLSHHQHLNSRICNKNYHRITLLYPQNTFLFKSRICSVIDHVYTSSYHNTSELTSGPETCNVTASVTLATSGGDVPCICRSSTPSSVIPLSSLSETSSQQVSLN